jgi:hypothetical protein
VGAVDADVGRGVDDADLELVLVVVDADEQWYVAYDPLLPDETLVN